jgi:predicted nucleic acid-binding protein
MNKFFLDTSYIIALELAKDQNHNAASDHWNQVLKSPFQLITTSYILDETATFFNSRGRHSKAVEIGEQLLQSASVNFLQVDESAFFQGWQLFKNRKESGYSLTDCISFVVMQKNAVSKALAFDRHFEQEGFQVFPAMV